MTSLTNQAKASTALSQFAASRSVFLVRGTQDQSLPTQILDSDTLIGECRGDHDRVGLCRSHLLREFAWAQPDGRNLDDFHGLTENTP
ncbi:MAG: hypothetical protein ACRDZO_09035 [Egibacteraceae bacterium]